MLIPVYLTDDDGNVITGEDGVGITVGFVQQDLFAGTSGELSTTFRTLIEDASLEDKKKVLDGLRLAKPIRGRLSRFQIGGEEHNTYVKYNHRIFGGRYKNEYTALGSVLGTYLRRGGTAFSKDLVQAALVTGPFASFSTFPSSPVLPGDVTFRVNAGGGDVTAFAWTITNNNGTTFAPTDQQVTVTLTEGTWDVSCIVTIDNTAQIVDGRTLEVSNLALTGSLFHSPASPVLGEAVNIGFPVNNANLLGDITWSFDVELAAGQRVDLTEGVDYTVNSESGNTINVTFLTAGDIQSTAVIEDASGSVVSTQANIDVHDFATTNTVTEHSILSQATADALVQGDTHMIVLGDSLNLPLRSTRWRGGMAASFKPARWAGIQPANSSFGENAGQAWSQNDEHDAHRHFSTGFEINRGQGGHANLHVDGTKGGVPVWADSRLAARRTQGGTYLEMDALNTSPTLGLNVTARSGSFADILRGRLQSPADTFYRASSVNSRTLFYNLDDTITLTGTASDATSDHSFTMDSEGYYLMEVERDATTGTDSFSTALDVSFDSIAADDIFGWMDSFVYSPSMSGLSISYLGDGGWNTTNHTSDAARVAANCNQVNQYYSDDAVAAHLDMVAWKNKTQTTLRDNVVIFFPIQNGSKAGEGHDGQMRKDLLTVKSRWEAAADVVDPSGSLKAKLKFIVVSMPDIITGNQHGRTAAMMPDIVGLGGYSNVEFIDLYNAIKTADGGIYADPNDYTGTVAGGSGTISPLWYGINSGDPNSDDGVNGNDDSVHPSRAGAAKQMEILWSVIQDAASDPTGFSFTINAPDGGTTDDTYNYTLSGSLPADRLVTWYVDDVETAYGDAFTLPAVEGTFVVKATVDGLDGASETVTAPAVSIVSPNASPAFTIQPRLEDDEEPIIEGGVVPIEFRATDADGGTLEYFVDGQSIGTFTQNSTVTANITAGSAGVLQTVNVSVSDGVAPAVSATPLTFTPSAANTAPTSSSAVSVTGSPAETGDTANITLTNISDDNTAISSLTYSVQVSIDGGTFNPVSSNPTGNVIDGGGNGIATASHVCSVAGDYVFRVTITDNSNPALSTNFDSGTFTIVVPAGPTVLQSQTFDVYDTSGGQFNNYYTGGLDTDLNNAVGVPSASLGLSRVQFSGNTSVGVQWSCGSTTNSGNFRDWLNANVDTVRMTTGSGDVLEYDLSTAFASTVSGFMRLSGAAFSLNGGSTGAYTFAMRSAMINDPDLVVEFIG